MTHTRNSVGRIGNTCIVGAVCTLATTLAAALAAGVAPTSEPATRPAMDPATPPPPAFAEVTVHDPAILRDRGVYYIIGSHLAAAKSEDLIRWTLIDEGVKAGNRVIPDVLTEMREALDWGQTKTFWAGAMVKLGDGRFYYYYSVCKGDSARSALGLAVAEKPEGPYRNVDILLKSGMWGKPSEDGTVFDATVHPNVVDPDVYFDPDGKLWMVYGSYSGGIFVMRLDPATGRPLAGQGYGKKLMGGNHSRIEAPAMLHNPDTGYYYLFTSFGGLASDGGYQIRVARSRQPDGPFVAPDGRDMIGAHGPKGSFFDDKAIEPFGAKLIGNFEWTAGEGETPIGYVSPGHNTTFFDPETRRSFLIFHTRFPGKGEGHQVRVHQLLYTPDGWPVMAPHRYARETPGTVSAAEVAGAYQLIEHGRAISKAVTRPVGIELRPDGTVGGERSGSWSLSGERTIRVTLGDTTYNGAALRQWHAGRGALGGWVMTFSAMSAGGEAVWGSR